VETNRWGVVCVAMVVGLVAAAGTAWPQGTSGLTEDAVYKKHCAKCHGGTAQGRMLAGPSLVSKKAAGMSDEELRTMITNGKGRMPKFAGKLSAEEINRLVAEIRTVNQK
jgi:cytochrome c6